MLPLARNSEKISHCRLIAYSEDDVDVIFRIANETIEMRSLKFSLALRLPVRTGAVGRTATAPGISPRRAT